MENRVVDLPSGAKLTIQPAPFTVAKALFQTALSEIKSVPVTTEIDFVAFFKDMFCTGFASPRLEACLWECFKRCKYNETKIDESTFDPVDARQDYMKVCVEVAKDNIGPFLKHLFAEYKTYLAMSESIQKSMQPTTT